MLLLHFVLIIYDYLDRNKLFIINDKLIYRCIKKNIFLFYIIY